MNLNPKKNPATKTSESFKQIAPYLGLGTQLAITILLLTLLGKYLDDHFGTKPLYTVIGAFCGAIAGLYNFIRSILSLDKKRKK